MSQNIFIEPLKWCLKFIWDCSSNLLSKIPFIFKNAVHQWTKHTTELNILLCLTSKNMKSRKQLDNVMVGRSVVLISSVVSTLAHQLILQLWLEGKDVEICPYNCVQFLSFYTKAKEKLSCSSINKICEWDKGDHPPPPTAIPVSPDHSIG